MRIAIVGGGIGGLTAALALLQRGYDVKVYEQAPELKELGAGVQISPNGSRILFDLGLKDEIMALASEPEGKEVRLWNTGRTWKLFDLGPVSMEIYGFPYLTLHRNDLHKTLAEAFIKRCPDGLVLGHACTGVEETASEAVLSFEGGMTATADIVVGADGVHSVIRNCLFGDGDPSFTGIVAWRGVIPWADVAPHMQRPVGTNWIGPGGHVIHYPLRRGELMNYVSVVERDDWQVESWSTQGTTEECLADYEGWHEDVRGLIRAVGTLNKWALILRPPMEQWSQGRVTLLGDACHPTLPFLAQGANMAIEDGLVFARALEAHNEDHVRAFEAYEAARVGRTAKIVRGSEGNIARFHNPALASEEGAVDYVDAEWTREKITERYDWLFRYDALTVPLSSGA